MFVYISSPFTSVHDKQQLMCEIERFCARLIVSHPGTYPLTGLQGFYIARHDESIGIDWQMWGEFSLKLIRVCEKVIVLKFPGWDTSTGVRQELDEARSLGLDIEYVDVSLP